MGRRCLNIADVFILSGRNSLVWPVNHRLTWHTCAGTTVYLEFVSFQASALSDQMDKETFEKGKLDQALHLEKVWSLSEGGLIVVIGLGSSKLLLISQSMSRSHYSKTIVSWISYELKLLNCIHVFYYQCIFCDYFLVISCICLSETK